MSPHLMQTSFKYLVWLPASEGPGVGHPGRADKSVGACSSVSTRWRQRGTAGTSLKGFEEKDLLTLLYLDHYSSDLNSK